MMLHACAWTPKNVNLFDSQDAEKNAVDILFAKANQAAVASVQTVLHVYCVFSDQNQARRHMHK